jgi:hypothetical protein
METSTGITAGSQDIRHAGTDENADRENTSRRFRRTADGGSRTRHGWATKVAAIAALGLAGALSVTACSPNPAPSPVPPHTTAPATSSPKPSTSTTQSAAQMNVPGPSINEGEFAQQVADYVVSEPLEAEDGTTATDASCDPATVSDPSDPSLPASVSCDITYSDGSVWQQTLVITFDSSGNMSDITDNDSIELSPATSE